MRGLLARGRKPLRGVGSGVGKRNRQRYEEFERLKGVLKTDVDGAQKVVRELERLLKRYPRRKQIGRVQRYFKRHGGKMRYAFLLQNGLPIGSGVVEAANKTLVTVRMKRAGARWSQQGGQAVLTWRELIKSGRFTRAWQLLADTYKNDVSLPENVVTLSNWR